MDSFERFKAILSFVWESDSLFYKRKYQLQNFQPSSIQTTADIATVPFLTRTDLTGGDLFDRLYLPLSEVVICGYTSGTTSQKLLPVWRNYFSSSLPKLPAKKNMVITAQPWRSVTQSEWFRRYGIFTICGDVYNLPLTAELARVIGIDCMYATPTVALLLAPILGRVYSLDRITTLFIHGEWLSDVRRQAIKEAYKSATIYTHYACSEVGPAGNSCPKSDDHYAYHQDPNFLYEVIDPVVGEPLPEGEEGELVISTLSKVPTPMIRYRTGDRGLIPGQTCSCSEAKPLFRVLGRVGFDVLKVGGFELKAGAFDKGVAKVAHHVRQETYEVHIFEGPSGEDVRPKLCFKLHPLRALTDEEKKTIVTTLRESIIVGSSLSIKEAEEKGHLLETLFEFGELPQEIPGLKKRRILISHV